MRKSLLILALLTFSLALNAQYAIGTSLTPEDRAKTRSVQKEYRDNFKKTGVKSITTEKQSFKNGEAKGDMKLAMKQVFNPMGQSGEIVRFQKKGKPIQMIQFDYDQDGRLKKRSYKRANGKLQSRTEYNYSGELLTGLDHYRGAKETFRRRQENEYDAKGWLQTTKIYNPKNNKLVRQIQCSYHEDGSKKRVERYNRRGKLKRATDYACGQEGKTVSGNKAKENTVCERFEVDADGKTVKIVEILIGGNSDMRDIAKYNERGNQLERTRYNKKGQIVYQFLNTYNDKGYRLTTARHGKGGKLMYRATFERGENGLAISEMQENEKGEIVKKQRYSYEYF